MSKEQIMKALAELKASPFHEIGESELSMVLHSSIARSGNWSKAAIEENLGIQLSPDLVDFWNETSGIDLHVDMTFGQWGIKLWSPQDVIRERSQFRVAFANSLEFQPGDLIIGEFIGDLEFIVTRCNTDEEDFGTVVIGIPEYERNQWPLVANTLGEFLERSVDAPGQKYWEK